MNPSHFSLPSVALWMISTLFVFGCGEKASQPHVEEIGPGIARLALSAVPANVSCIVLRFEGTRTIIHYQEVAARENALVTVSGLELGPQTVTVTGHDMVCTQIMPSTLTWMSSPAPITIVEGIAASANVALYPVTAGGGSATIQIEFGAPVTPDPSQNPTQQVPPIVVIPPLPEPGSKGMLFAVVEDTNGRNQVVAIDLALNQSTRTFPLYSEGPVTLGFSKGNLYVADLTGVAVFDPMTLDMRRKILAGLPGLSFSPQDAVFSPDGQFVYLLHRSTITQVNLATGAEIADITLPLPESVGQNIDQNIRSLALNSTGTRLGITSYYGNGLVKGSAVTFITINGDKLSVLHSVVAPLINGCTPHLENGIFSSDDQYLATFDSNCKTFGFYHVKTGELEKIKQPMHQDDKLIASIIIDANQQMWAKSNDTLYQVDLNPGGVIIEREHTGYSTLALGAQKKTIYAFGLLEQGISTLDPSTGILTPLALDLTSVQPSNARILSALYVEKLF